LIVTSRTSFFTSFLICRHFIEFTLWASFVTSSLRGFFASPFALFFQGSFPLHLIVKQLLLGFSCILCLLAISSIVNTAKQHRLICSPILWDP
jgi:hypothetical protein